VAFLIGHLIGSGGGGRQPDPQLQF